MEMTQGPWAMGPLRQCQLHKQSLMEGRQVEIGNTFNAAQVWGWFERLMEHVVIMIMITP